ncbi:hypothetical protein D521_0327 [beta proteobacterium CB]|nr:hypothetical protein D521_0327 [beta proteobacterium CB]
MTGNNQTPRLFEIADIPIGDGVRVLISVFEPKNSLKY